MLGGGTNLDACRKLLFTCMKVYDDMSILNLGITEARVWGCILQGEHRLPNVKLDPYGVIGRILSLPFTFGSLCSPLTFSPLDYSLGIKRLKPRSLQEDLC